MRVVDQPGVARSGVPRWVRAHSTLTDSTPTDSTPTDSTPTDSTPTDSTPTDSTRPDSTRPDSTRTRAVVAIHTVIAVMCFGMLAGTFCNITVIAQELASPPQQDLTRSDVFVAGDQGITLYRIPGVVVTPSGTVLAYCEARRDSRSDWGEIEVQLRRSEDSGRTWEVAQQIAHRGQRIEGNPRKKTGGEHEQTVNNPVAIVDRETGSIEFLYCINYARCFSMRSLDDGRTFSEPVEITSAFEPFRSMYDWRVIATGPGHGIQLRSGRLVVPIWLAYGQSGDHAPSASATIYSDDHGVTWHAGEIAVPDEGDFNDPNESMVTELSDGRVLMISRSVSKPNRKLVTFSPDGATGWSKPEFHSELPEPICMASIIALPAQQETVVFSNPHTLALDSSGQEIPAGRGKRRNLTIKLSRDNGLTWPQQRTLEIEDSAYSDLTILPDGRIGCLYEGRDRLIFATFTAAWISDGP
ncbi:MAG: exo-alpha-sialidase [Planctomyces sp.]|nr:exo-alpha-sialidase [Planctomyces sp.]